MDEDEALTAVQDEPGLLLDELRSFQANRAAGVTRKCVSNLYYGAFHAVRSLLLAHGLESRTHEGTQRLFAAHFVKPGRIRREHLKTLAQLEADRLRADYQGFHQFDSLDVADARDRVAPLIQDALDYLESRDARMLLRQGPGIRKELVSMQEEATPQRHPG